MTLNPRSTTHRLCNLGTLFKFSTGDINKEKSLPLGVGKIEGVDICELLEECQACSKCYGGISYEHVIKGNCMSVSEKAPGD